MWCTLKGAEGGSEGNVALKEAAEIAHEGTGFGIEDEFSKM